jgi:hypothetical protein
VSNDRRDAAILDIQLCHVLFERFYEELEKDLPEMRALLKGKANQVFQEFVNIFLI